MIKLTSTQRNIFFTSDEHYYHHNIIKYCNRPFHNVYEMNFTIFQNHNNIVSNDDVVIHLGDFYLGKDINELIDLINSLNGKHIFIKGSHDRWIKQWKKVIKECSHKLYTTKVFDILKVKIDNNVIVCCHYAMRIWPLSHYNSWHVYGHSHCAMVNREPYGKSIDVGIDCNNFKPYSYNDIKEIMDCLPDNVNKVV